MEYFQYLMGQRKCQFDLVRHRICVTSSLQWQANRGRSNTSRSPSYANGVHVEGDLSLTQWFVGGLLPTLSTTVGCPGSIM